MEYISVKDAANIWGIDTSRVGRLARSGKIEGAKIVGRNWLIPKNASKPVDGRTRKAKECQDATVFRFPLYANFPEDSFVPPLSAEELKLRQAQLDFYSCEFQNSKTSFEDLAENAKNIYVKMCAQFFMCVLSAEYDMNINWKKYYCGLNLIMSTDFPRKKEMELLLPWLDLILGQFINIPDKLNCDDKYEFHPSAWYMNALLSAFNYYAENTETANPKCTEPFGTLCRIMESEGYFIEAQELHIVMFAYYYGVNDNESMEYHLRKVVRLAYEHDLLFAVADAETYYADKIDLILREYPESFSEKIRSNSKTVYANFARFAASIEISNMYAKLSKSDYCYVFYALKGFPNKQVADICNVSERTVVNKYNDIYDKLGLNSKHELVTEMQHAFGQTKSIKD